MTYPMYRPPPPPSGKIDVSWGEGGSVHRLLWPYVGSFPITSSLLHSRSLSRHATLETKNGCEATRLTPFSPHFRAWHRRSCYSTHRPTICNGVALFTQFVFHWTLSNGGQVMTVFCFKQFTVKNKGCLVVRASYRSPPPPRFIV